MTAETRGRPRVDAARDIDDVAVRRAVTGESPFPEMTGAERYAATLELHAQGDSYPAIAAKLHITPRTVCRYLQRAGLTKPRVA